MSIEDYINQEKFQKVYDIVEPWIFEEVHRCNGSISAEHGIGNLKKQYLKLSKDQSAIDLMKSIKNAFDPNHILNPYKMFE